VVLTRPQVGVVEGSQVAAASLAEPVGVVGWRRVRDTEGCADVGVTEGVGLVRISEYIDAISADYLPGLEVAGSSWPSRFSAQSNALDARCP
jgi:hypothetical protein